MAGWDLSDIATAPQPSMAAGAAAAGVAAPALPPGTVQDSGGYLIPVTNDQGQWTGYRRPNPGEIPSAPEATGNSNAPVGKPGGTGEAKNGPGWDLSDIATPEPLSPEDAQGHTPAVADALVRAKQEADQERAAPAPQAPEQAPATQQQTQPQQAPTQPVQETPPTATAQTQAPTTPGTTAQAQDFFSRLLGSTAATLEGIPRGIFGGKTVDYVDALGGTPMQMLFSGMGPSEAFNHELQVAQGRHQQYANQYPIASTLGNLTGAVGTGVMAAPALAFKAPAAVGLLPKLGAAAEYLGKNAAFGGLMSSLNGEDAGTGAELGAGLAAGIPVVGRIASAVGTPLAWMTRQLPALLSSSSRIASNARNLGRAIQPGDIQTSSVGPLDLAQATGNPTIAGKVDYAEGKLGADQFAPLRQQQSEAMRNQLGQVGDQALPADAGSRLTNAIRASNDMADAQEEALWNVPALKSQAVQTNWLKNSVADAAKNLPPGLQAGLDGAVQRQLDILANFPDQATVGDINSIRSALLRIGRTHSESNPQAAPAANALADAFLQAMDRTLSTAKVNPNVLSAWRAARNFTSQYRSMFGGRDLTSITAERGGIPVKDASEASRGLFNFSLGSPEGGQTLADLADFVGGLHDTGAAALSAEVRNAARSYIASALREAGKLNPNQKASTGAILEFLRKNGPWLRKSGILDSNQIRALDDFADYVEMLHRPNLLQTQGNAATNKRGEYAKTFIDEIMHPWIRHFLALGGVIHGGMSHGAEGGVVGLAVGSVLEGGVVKAENAMREIMAEMLADPEFTKQAMMKATPANRMFLSPRTKELLGKLRLALQADVAPSYLSPASQAPAQVGNQ